MTNDNRPAPERLMTTAEAAALIGVDPKTLARWDRAGKLGKIARTPGGHRRYRESHLLALLGAARPKTPGATPPSAYITVGPDGGDLYWTPTAGQVPVPGAAGIILGWTVDGQAVTLATTSLPWLDDLEAAIQLARARAVVNAELAVTP